MDYTTNLDKSMLHYNFVKAFMELVSDDSITEVKIPQDDKFYLRKTKYMIQIRSNESTTWLAYVMHQNMTQKEMITSLFNKYKNLVALSDVKHFHGNLAVAN